MRNLDVYGTWFCGHEVSPYGKEHGFVDYATFAKAFDAVLANGLMESTADIGYWEQTSGFTYSDGYNHYSPEERDELLEELEARRDELEELEELTDDQRDELEELEERLEALEEEYFPEVYQWYIISTAGADLCEDANEIVYYNEELDLYLWGVTHWGTSWGYVLTGIRCNTEKEGE